MARRAGMRTAPLILVLILLILVLLFGGLLWFDYLGMLDIKETLSPVLNLVGIGAPEPLPEDESIYLLDEERLKKLDEALTLREEELDARETELDAREAELNQKIEIMAEREAEMEEREKSFNDRLKQYENRSAALRQSSEYFVGMPPDAAVERLLAMDDQDIIDILRMTETIAAEQGNASIVPYWLSLMPADRAADLSRKMLRKP